MNEILFQVKMQYGFAYKIEEQKHNSGFKEFGVTLGKSSAVFHSNFRAIGQFCASKSHTS